MDYLRHRRHLTRPFRHESTNQKRPPSLSGRGAFFGLALSSPGYEFCGGATEGGGYAVERVEPRHSPPALDIRPLALRHNRPLGARRLCPVGGFARGQH